MTASVITRRTRVPAWWVNGVGHFGVEGDTEIGDGTERTTYPQTALMVNLGKVGNEFNRILGSYVMFLARTSDPPKPANGQAVIWLSDGSGLGSPGNDGDVLVASTTGGVTRWGTLFDKSAGAVW